jgi:hypothetical protein
MPWVLYLTALKPCRANYATFLDPLLLPGKKGASRWQQALATIPADAICRIQAVVVDNLPGMRRLAYERQWVLQLCHFHSLLKLQAQRRGVRYALRGGPVRDEIHQLVREALQLPDGRSLSRGLRCRIDGAPSTADVPQQPRRLKLSRRAPLGDSPHSHTTKRDLQWSFAQQKILTHPQLVTTSVGADCRGPFQRRLPNMAPSSSRPRGP